LPAPTLQHLTSDDETDPLLRLVSTECDKDPLEYFTRLFAVCAFIAIVGIDWACAGNPTGPSTLDGTWGGDQMTMSISDTTHFELACAHGDIPGPLAIDTRRQFNVSGTFTREHGGPIRIGETSDTHAASYSGSVSGDHLGLTIRLTDTGETIGTFSLTRGVSGRVVKCL
jgi:hypothetical protein